MIESLEKSPITVSNGQSDKITISVTLLIKYKGEVEGAWSRMQGGREHWAVYYTSPKSFIITFPDSLA